MKQILLFLVLLSSMPLFSKDGTANANASAAASAAVDEKAKAANATANPTATMGNSASAAVVPEVEVKRSGTEADLKGDAQNEFTYEQLMEVVHPALLEKICRKSERYDVIVPGNANIVIDYLIPPREMWKTIVRRAEQLYWNLKWKVAEIAAPKSMVRDVSDALMPYALEHHNSQFPKDISQIVSDYAQQELRPIEQVFKDVMNSEAMQAVQRAHIAFTNDESVTNISPRVREYRELLDTQGAVFPHAPRIERLWNDFGFAFAPEYYRSRYYEGGRAICPTCGPEFNDAFLGSSNFGDVSGLAFSWRKPFMYHRSDCERRKGLQPPDLLKDPGVLRHLEEQYKTEDELEQAKLGIKQLMLSDYSVVIYGENVSCAREEFVRLMHHVMLHLDLYARNASEQNGPMKDLANAWLEALNTLDYWMTLAPRKYAYIQDPQAWIEAENKRAEELITEVRYKLPEKPATK